MACTTGDLAHGSLRSKRRLFVGRFGRFSGVEAGEQLGEGCDVLVAEVVCGWGDDVGRDTFLDLTPECGCVGCGFNDDAPTVGVTSRASDQVVGFEAGEDLGEGWC